MLQGKVSSALRWLNAQCSLNSLKINDEILDKLKEKHPPAQPSSENDLLEGPHNKVEAVIFDEIDAQCIYRSALTTKGSGGPTAVDAETWKRFLCSKSFGNNSSELCESIARLAWQISTKQIPSSALKFFLLLGI